MRFGSPEILNALWLLLPLFFFLRWAWKARLKALQRFGNLELIEKLMRSVSREKQRLKLVLIFFVFAFSLFALAQPKWGQKEFEIVSRGSDVIIALDVSRSMLAEDIKPNRLAKAKQEILSLIDHMRGNRIGLIIFAGDAFVQCPLTLDYAAAKLLLREVEVGSVPVPGTAIGSAIDKAIASYPQGDRESRVLILITDGEDTVSDPLKAVERAEEENVLIYTIGIGDSAGVPIPIRNEDGNVEEYVTDGSGKAHSSKLDEETLRTIALTTGGAYHGVRSAFKLIEIYEHMEQRRQARYLESRFISQFEERYQFFLFPALVLLLIEMLLTDRKKIKPKITVQEKSVELQERAGAQPVE